MKSRNSAAPHAISLIVNADDFGLSPGVNTGIVDAHRRGILTSATLLANAPCFDEAVRLAGQNPGLGVGAHLNIVRGIPLSPPEQIPLLVDGAGRFRPFRLRRMSGEFLRQAGLEYRAQLRKICDAGISLTHIDFEKHHAWQGPLYRTACKAAAEFGIRAVRSLMEPVAWTVRKVGWPGVSAAAMAASLRCGVQLSGRGSGGLARPDYFMGECHIGRMSEAVWLRLIAALPPGVTEVMTHPGLAEKAGFSSAMGESWLDGAREVEYAALCASAVRQAIDARSVDLVHFGDCGRCG